MISFDPAPSFFLRFVFVIQTANFDPGTGDQVESKEEKCIIFDKGKDVEHDDLLNVGQDWAEAWFYLIKSTLQLRESK